MSERSTVWAEYLAAAQRLDAVRRDASDTAAAESGAVAAARQELPGVQARLGMQAARLHDLAARTGAPAPMLHPGPAERAAAAQAVAGGPTVVLAALRQARSTVDVADASLARLDGAGETGPQALRNLTVYGTLGVLVMIAQLAFALLVDERTRTLYAAGCGFVFAAIAFGIGWLLVGVLYPKRPRTALLGALACFGPMLLIFIMFAVL